ncbi:MAG: N-acetylglucosamine kinase [Gemmataceae bacterium]
MIGLDGGGTKTVAVLARGGKKDFSIIGRGVSSASNPRVVGFDNAICAINDAVRHAFTDAKIPVMKPGLLVAGISGAGREEEKNILHKGISNLAKKVVITTDASLVLEEGLMEGWGIAVISGTGSMVLGKNQQGESFRSGGWGNILGDEGSAYALGMGALKLVTQIADGRKKTSLLNEKILANLQITHAQEIVAMFSGKKLEKARIAGLAIEVLHAQEQGDQNAAVLINEQAGLLSACVVAVYNQMKIKDEMVPLTLAGSLLCKSDEYRRVFLEHLSCENIKLGMLTLVHEPALGALRLAVNLKLDD